MRALGILVIIPLASVILSFTMKNGNSDFYIIFGSGFRNDTVSLTINDTRIFEKIVLQSDTITGVSNNVSVSLEEGNLMFLKDSKVSKKDPFKHDGKLQIVIIINDRPYVLMAELKKGKYIVISKHWYYYNVYLNQYKKPVSFE